MILMCPRAKRFNYAPFFEVAQITVFVVFWSCFETKWRYKYVFATL